METIDKLGIPILRKLPADSRATCDRITKSIGRSVGAVLRRVRRPASCRTG